MRTFIACLLIVAAAYIYKKLHTGGNAPEEAPAAHPVSFHEIECLIDELAQLKEHLEEIENMITDIESCEPSERATAFTISMPANNRSAVFLANRSSESILNLLYSERHRLRSSIVQIVRDLSGVCQKNVKNTSAIKCGRGVASNE